eukprot:TRINITY_DN33267_c0_g1_i1.p1 TRINITY_DN33267_c0_g1~~TRINITY_DN33267_c0_g1_i1.p1  ORF type:complete len:599 (+),score=142.63 TRINITY_DN33267_c0_g1_i1:110-1906(+)
MADAENPRSNGISEPTDHSPDFRVELPGTPTASPAAFSPDPQSPKPLVPSLGSLKRLTDGEPPIAQDYTGEEGDLWSALPTYRLSTLTMVRSANAPMADPEQTATIMGHMAKRMAEEKQDSKDPEVFDEFSPKVFVYEVISHTLQPVFIPLNLLFDGWIAVQNYQFLTHPLQLGGLLCIGAAAVHYLEDDDQWVSPLALDFSLGFCFWIYRQLVIATKYSLYPPSEYQRMRTEILTKELNHHLLVVWALSDVDRLLAEVQRSMIRVQADLSTIGILFTRPCSRGEVLRVPALDVVRQVLLGTVEDYANVVRFFNPVGVAVGSTYVLLLWAPLDGEWVWSGMAWPLVVGKVCLSFFIWMCAYALYAVAAAAGLHVYRAYLIMQQMGATLSMTANPGYTPCTTRKFKTSASVHKISFQHPENIYNWYTMRLVLLNTGRRFDNRASLYIAYAAIVMLGFLAVAVIRILRGGVPTRHEIAVTLQTCLLMSLLIAGTIFAGARANTIQRQQAAQLAQEEVRIGQLQYSLQCRQQSADMPLIRDQLNASLEALAKTRRAMKNLASIDAVRVFGVSASYQMLTSFGTVCGSVLVLALQYLASQDL